MPPDLDTRIDALTETIDGLVAERSRLVAERDAARTSKVQEAKVELWCLGMVNLLGNNISQQMGHGEAA